MSAPPAMPWRLEDDVPASKGVSSSAALEVAALAFDVRRFAVATPPAL